MYKNSIYIALRKVAGGNQRKLAVSYLFGIFKGREKSFQNSKDPLVDEGRNVYQSIDSIGINTLYNAESIYTSFIQSKLETNAYIPIKGTVEEVVLQMVKAKGLEKTLDQVGEALDDVLKRKPNFGAPLDEIQAGYIQRLEQKAIRDELSKYLPKST
jgi:hypothetical protein